MKQGEGIIRDNCELLTNGRGGGMDGVQLVFIVRHQRSVAKAARHWEVLQVGRFFFHTLAPACQTLNRISTGLNLTTPLSLKMD